MKILLAKTAGFCMGVRRAVEMVLDAPHKHENPIYTFGPLIHNPQVLNLLEEKGISVITEVPEKGSGTVLIRAHGVPPQSKEDLKQAGFRIIDATCPHVIKVQTIIGKYAKQGYASIIIGDKDHPEVIGLLGYAKGKGYVIDNLEDLNSLPSFDNAVIVAQTTQNKLFFERVKDWAQRQYPHYKHFHTICDATTRRQAEVQRLANDVDTMIVVGGRDSGNTQRLAQIAKQAGVQTFHVEDESGLDFDKLASTHNIGITAGASTPNWIIKRIYRALEIFPFKKRQRWYNLLFTLQRPLLLTNIYVSIGAGSLCYACTRLQGISDNFPNVLISILYVQSMHILNNLIGTKADRYNDPDRASFYDKNKILLSLLAFIAGGVGLMTAYTIGLIPFIILLIMSVLGLSYDFKIIPKQFFSGRYRKIRDIPGSKTILIAIAWGIVTSVLPFMFAAESEFTSTVWVFLWSTSLVFARTAFFDILDMQGDRIVGKETIPILLGEKKAIRLLKAILLANFAILIISALFSFLTSLGFVLAICPVFVFIVISAHDRGYMLPGTRLEFLVETNFVLAGFATLIWSLF